MVNNQLQITRLYLLTFSYRRSTFVENPLQIHYFLCKTNPIYSEAQMNVTSVITTNYKENHPSSHPQNKPNSNPIQSQTNPIGSDAQNERNLCYNNRLRRKPAFQPPPKQTQFKPKTKPIKLFHICVKVCPERSRMDLQNKPQMNVTSVLTNHYENQPKFMPQVSA